MGNRGRNLSVFYNLPVMGNDAVVLSVEVLESEWCIPSRMAVWSLL